MPFCWLKIFSPITFVNNKEEMGSIMYNKSKTLLEYKYSTLFVTASVVNNAFNTDFFLYIFNLGKY